MKNKLVENYLIFMFSKNGMNKSQCANHLSDIFKRTYDVNKICRWERGAEKLPRRVNVYMTRFIMRYMILAAGGTLPERNTEQLCNSLSGL